MSTMLAEATGILEAGEFLAAVEISCIRKLQGYKGSLAIQ
jgi:hypothetical protein